MASSYFDFLARQADVEARGGLGQSLAKAGTQLFGTLAVERQKAQNIELARSNKLADRQHKEDLDKKLLTEGREFDRTESDELVADTVVMSSADLIRKRTAEGKSVEGILPNLKFNVDVTERGATLRFAQDVDDDDDATISAKTQFLPGGLTMTVDSKGTRVVRDGAGKRLTDQAALAAIIAAEDRGTALQGARSGARQLGKDVVKADTDFVDTGFRAAKTSIVLRRVKRILETVDTGGWAAVTLKMKQTFGLENADEGEMLNLLGKAVLAQLKPTFGAQFSENEGNRLIAIEAGYTKSTAANIQIITQELKRLQLDAEYGRSLAESRGEKGRVAEINKLLEFDLSPPSEAEQNRAARASAVKKRAENIARIKELEALAAEDR